MSDKRKQLDSGSKNPVDSVQHATDSPDNGASTVDSAGVPGGIPPMTTDHGIQVGQARSAQQIAEVPDASRAKSKRGRIGIALGLLGLPAAIAALAGCGYLYYQFMAMSIISDRRTSEHRQLIADIDVRVQLDQLGAHVDTLRQDSGRWHSDNAARIDELQDAVRVLQEIGSRSDRAWVIAETRYLLKMAQYRLMLAGDLNSAVLALRAADAQLHQLADVNLLPVRSVLAEEIALLRSTEKPDIEGKVLALIQLARRSNTLPLSIVHRDPSVALQPAHSAAMKTEEVSDSGTDILQFLQRYIVIKPAPTPTAALADLALGEASDTLSQRASLQLALQKAQVAALRRDQVDFLAATTSAQSLLSEYFNTDEERVQHFIADLDSVEQLPVRPKIEGFGKALRLLNKIEIGRGDVL